MFKYRPEIDGLRALAVIPVVLFHFGLGFPGGYVGVDVFFVISGYLITSIILKELGEGSFRFRNFWLRRVRRLFPALGCVLIVTLVAGWFWLLPEDYKSLSGQVMAVLAFMANVKFYTQSGYWSPAAEEIPLLHTWSLAVEEQFYFITPFLLTILWKAGSKRIPGVLSVLALVSLIASIMITPTSPDFAFYLLPTRAWELLIGCIIAAYGTKLNISNRIISTVLGWLGITLILLTYFTFNSSTPFPSWRALAPCLGAGFLLISNQAGMNSSGKLLSAMPFVFVGKISYSLYLWHWPVFVFLRYTSADEFLDWKEQVTGVALSLILAIASWKWIENPFRFGKKKIPKTIGFAIPTTFAVIALSAVTVRTLNGLENRPIFPEEMRSFFHQDDSERLQFDVKDKWNQGGELINANLDSNFPQLVVIGSSHAVMYGPLIQSLVLEYQIPTSFLTAGGIYGRFDLEELDFPFTQPQTPNREDKLETDRVRLDLLKRWNPKLVLWIDRWDTHLSGFSESELEKTFNHSLDLLKETSENVVVFGQPPRLDFQNNSTLINDIWNKYLAAGNLQFLTVQKELPTNRGKVESILNEICTKHRARFVNVDNFFLNGDSVILLSDSGKLLFRDDDHLSIEGTQKLEPVFREILEAYFPNGCV